MYQYAPMNRPAGYATAPPYRTEVAPPSAEFRHGIIAYESPLSAEDCAKWEFLDLQATARFKPGMKVQMHGDVYIVRDVLPSSVSLIWEGSVQELADDPSAERWLVNRIGAYGRDRIRLDALEIVA